MDSPGTPRRAKDGGASSSSPARTPRGRRILSSGGDDSPLPPLVEVAADKEPAPAPLVSAADDADSSREATVHDAGPDSPADTESMDAEQQLRGTAASNAADRMDVDGGGAGGGGGQSSRSARQSLFELGFGSMARMSNTHQIQPLVAALKNNDDAMQQLVALQELTELLSMSTEDSLIGLDVGDLARVLVHLITGAGGELGGFDTGNADVMLLACRCLANLVEALPLAGPVLLHCGALPALCAKLLDVEYIDVAEQALAVLARLSSDFGAQICEAGGMAACLMFLDFFATSTQCTALACAANCARSITSAQFPQACEAMPVLERTAFHSDQKIADLSCSAILHLAAAFRASLAQMERLISEDLLRRIVASIHPSDEYAAAPAMLLRVLATVVTVSGHRAAQILDMGIIPALAETLASSFSDSRALLYPTHAVSHSRGAQHPSALQLPEREWEALRLLVAVLPRLPTTDAAQAQLEAVVCSGGRDGGAGEGTSAEDGAQIQRLKDIYARPDVLQQLQDMLVPLMIRVFAQTINVSAQYRALLVVLKTTFFLDSDRLRVALDAVNLPSFLATTISQLESPVVAAISLLVVRIVLNKVPGHNAKQFAREGVVDGLFKLAQWAEGLVEHTHGSSVASISGHSASDSDDDDDADGEGTDDTDDDNAADDDADNADDDDPDGDSGAADLAAGFRLTSVHVPASSRHGTVSAAQRLLFAADALSVTDNREATPLIRWVLCQSRALSRELDGGSGTGTAAGDDSVLARLGALAVRLRAADLSHDALLECTEVLAEQLASVSSATCYELMQSGLVASLADALAREGVRGSAGASNAVRSLLRRHPDGQLHSAATSTFAILLGRLQESLSHAEHLHVCEAYRAGADEGRSPAHMLAKQIRFAVSPASADAVGEAPGTGSGLGPATAATVMGQIRRSFQNIRVSVHAVATFSVLEAYLRPRIAMLVKRSGRGRRHRNRLPAPAAIPPLPDIGDNEDGSSLRPQEAQLGRVADTAGASTLQRDRQRSRQREHIRMLRMIAQASGIDLRPAALLDGLDLDTSASDGDSDAGSDSDTDEPADGGGNAAQLRSSHADGVAAGKADDWHLCFVLKVDEVEVPVDAHDNIFGTIHRLWQQDRQRQGTSPWGQTFELQFHTAFGPRPQPAPDAHGSRPAPPASDDELDGVLGAEGATAVRLLKLLHDLLPQARLPASGPGSSYEDAVADLDSMFVNRTITAKAVRQLSDPLVVVCGALPDWCRCIVACVPFLTSFGSRLAYMQAAFFGYSRNINYWQAVARRGQRAASHTSSADLQIPLGHVQRQKVRISRHRILESALKVLELYGTAKTILEVEYFDEVGSGVGPTLEFYATISHCLQERSLGLWRDDGRTAAPDPELERADDGDAGHVCAPCGLFPAPVAGSEAPIADSEDPVTGGSRTNVVLPPSERTVQLFAFIGRLVAKGLIDGRVLDIPLSTEFWVAVQRHLVADSGAGAGAEQVPWTWSQLEALDGPLASSLRYLQGFVEAKDAIYARRDRDAAAVQANIDAIRGPDGQTTVEDLALDFSLPGYPSVELRPGGAEVPVTINNVHSYIDLVAQWTLWKGVRSQVAAFCDGFDHVLSSRSLLLFTPSELAGLVGQAAGDDEHWTRPSLLAAIKVDHGLATSSPLFQMFLDLLVSLSKADRRQFLRFATGSPRLPLGGFGALHPPLTVVPRPAEPPLTSDDYLPTVMTCANYIKHPGYSSPDVLVRRWRQAMSDGQQSFHLS